MVTTARQYLLDSIRASERETSFGRLLVPNNLYNKVATTAQELTVVHEQITPSPMKKTSPKAKPVEIKVVGSQSGTTTTFRPNGLYFSATVDFALGAQGKKNNPALSADNVPKPALTKDEIDNWGTGFGNPLVNPKQNAVYIVRATIAQLHVEPLISGFRLKWEYPAGWKIADGKSASSQYVEASSNPLIVMRKFLSPPTKSKTNLVFRCRIIGWYP